MVAEEAVEIWDAVTLKLTSTVQSPTVATRFRHGISYSPDGCSLAGCSDTAIVIWDTQTGGIVKEIKCRVTSNGLELMWSLDGRKIGTVSPRVLETLTVHIYDVALGTASSPCTLQSRDKPYFWAQDKSFQIATTTGDRKGCIINIFEVGFTLTKIKSFPLQFHSSPGPFSPTTYRISISIPQDRSHDPKLLILDVHNLKILLQETGSYQNLSFSPDGSLFAAFTRDHLSIWRYTSGCYTQWRIFQQTPIPLQFSPTLSSILGHAGALLHILHLDYSPADPTMKIATTTCSQPLDAFSPCGVYIATTHRQQSTIEIINLCSQNPSPSQFIDTDFEISEMVLTGNILLVKGSDKIVAWLLTEEGAVDGIFGNRRAKHSDSLWDISPQDKNPSLWARLLQRQGGDYSINGHLEFSVGDEIAAIRHNGCVICVYHTGTGETFEPVETPLHSERTWYHFHNPHQDDCNLYHRGLDSYNELPKFDWPVSQTTLQDGWVRDPEGKHRLWLHAHWRSTGNDIDWLGKVTTLRLRNSSELVIIKF